MARHYTLEEAQAQLAVVEPVLRDAVRLKREYEEAIGRFTTPTGALAGPDQTSRAQPQAQIEALRQEILERVRFITGLSIQVKDLDVGLIDFPTMRGGDQVLLCWRLGERSVAYWHTAEDGYPGRRPI